jgi:ABC-type amino acid transport system permease subunit
MARLAVVVLAAVALAGDVMRAGIDSSGESSVEAAVSVGGAVAVSAVSSS